MGQIHHQPVQQHSINLWSEEHADQDMTYQQSCTSAAPGQGLAQHWLHKAERLQALATLDKNTT